MAFNFSTIITENKILKAIYICNTGYQEIDGKHYIKNTYEVHIGEKYFTYNEYDATREKGQFC